jgi:hypothetical protein
MDIHNDEEYEGEEWKLKPLKEAVAPLKGQADEILKMVIAICATITDEDELLKDQRSLMMEDVYKLPVKISGAMATLDYILMMENAVIIKLLARNLMTACSALDMFDYTHTDYLRALRSELDVFKKLFAKWVRCFPREEPLWPDGWGLFYSPEDIEIWNRINPTEQVEE